MEATDHPHHDLKKSCLAVRMGTTRRESDGRVLLELKRANASDATRGDECEATTKQMTAVVVEALSRLPEPGWWVLVAPLALNGCGSTVPVARAIAFSPHSSLFVGSSFDDAANAADATTRGTVRIVDMTQRIDESMPFYPGGQRLLRCPYRHRTSQEEPSPYRTDKKDEEEGGRQGFSSEKEMFSFIAGCDLGTHVDSPSHFEPGGRSITDLPLRELVCPLVVIDCRHRCVDDEEQTQKGTLNTPQRTRLHCDYAMTVEDIVAHEATHGRIPETALVCMRTGWSTRFGDPARYKGTHSASSANGVGDEASSLHFPGFSLEAAQFLAERCVTAIGIDTLSLDVGCSTDFPVHSFMLGQRGKYQVENMVLEAVPPVGAVAVVLPWPVEGAFEAMCRAVALVPDPLPLEC